MGLKLESANEQQKLFIEELKADPTKGAEWVDILGVATQGIEILSVAKRVGKSNEELEPIRRLLAITLDVSITKSFPGGPEGALNSDDNPNSARMRADIVKYCALGGALPPNTQWNEEKTSIETGEDHDDAKV